MRGQLKAQMVKIIKVEKDKNGKNYVIFRVADRMKRKDANGEKVSDFYTCKAFGNNAEKIINEFSATDSDGKLISRKVDFWGKLETYKDTVSRECALSMSIGKFIDQCNNILVGKDINKLSYNQQQGVERIDLFEDFDFTFTSFIFLVEHIEYADTLKEKNETSTNKGKASDDGPKVRSSSNNNSSSSNKSNKQSTKNIVENLKNFSEKLDNTIDSVPNWEVSED